MSAAYEEAMGREILDIQSNISADDLVIQWDVCMEVMSVDTNDQREGLSEWEPPGDPMERYLKVVKLLSSYQCFYFTFSNTRIFFKYPGKNRIIGL